MDEFRTGYVWQTHAGSHDSPRIRRGQRRSDGALVVLKAPRGEDASTADLARIRHEHAILQKLHGAPVAQAVEIVRLEQGLGLVLEDVGSRSFASLIAEGRQPLPRFLRLARLAAEALGAVHARGILHKDVKPHHFFTNETDTRVTLVDFDIATTVAREHQRPDRPEALEGTLSYMSPEQTGRMNRSVDRRSDLYSLGVTFYELLTGALPFDTADPLELVHCHVARFARTPAELAGVPRVLSDIVMRLLEKGAEQRYQTAAGVAADLAHCEAEFAANKAIVPFTLAEHDHSHELRVPQKLYGRKAEVALMRRALERVKIGERSLVLVTGSAGVGKSALVHELHQELGVTGTFAAGKFDQFNRATPYSALARATRELVRSELACAPERLARWKADVLEVVGDSGRVLLEIVPELELLIGPQPSVVALGAGESLNRFERLFQRFLQVTAGPGRPAIFFLDDLQWADAASLRLVRSILQNTEQRSLLVIGSYRQNELGAAHPLGEFLSELEKGSENLRVELGPLELEHIEELLCDTFPRRVHPVGPLARALRDKTDGNPFFIGQFLESIHHDGKLWFDPERRAWAWQLDAISAASVTANVVELVVSRLHRFDAETRQTLSLAACIGHRFDVRGVAAIAGRTWSDVASSLWHAVEAGLLIPLDENYQLVSHAARSTDEELNGAYRFTHDRVQQAAYVLIPEQERGLIHLDIGRRLLAAAGENGLSDEAVFQIAGTLNLGRKHVKDGAERLRIAELDVRAARRAKLASAPATASELCEVALELLGDEPFAAHYELSHAAHALRAECAHIVGNDAAALASVAELKRRSRTLLERVEAWNLHVLVLTHQGRLAEASATSIQALGLLGVTVPDPSDKAALGAAIGREFGAYQAGLAGRSVESLGDIPRMTDEEKLALLRTCFSAIPAAFQSNPELMVWLVLLGVKQPLEHGTSPLSPYFYAQYAIVHSVATSDYETAYRFGRLALELSEHAESRAYLGAVHFLNAGFNWHWSRPFRECLEQFRKGIGVSFQLGDPMHGAYCLGVGAAARFFSGEPLDSIEADLGGYMQTVKANNDVINVGFVTIIRETIRCLTGRSAALDGFDDEAAFEAGAPPPIAAMHGATKAILRYLAGKPAEALEALDRFPPLPAVLYNVDCSTYRALALLEIARGEPEAARAEYLERVQPELEKHARWAAACSENFAHRHTLLLAECESLAGRFDAAMSLYDKAIAQALEREFPQYAALGSELCGKFHLRAGRSKIARTYLVEAHHHYERWGARAKSDELVRTYAELGLAPAGRESVPSAHTSKRKTTASNAAAADAGLDLLSAMRATQAMASELVLEKLVERLLRILVENAGARRGSLLLHEPGGLRLIATFRLDPEQIELGLSQPLSWKERVPASVVHYVTRSREPVVLDDASRAQRFARDEYLQSRGSCSVLCMPLLHQGELSAVLYVENAAVSAAFTADRLQRLQFLGSHAAVAIENAKLYGKLQAATRRLEEANDTLEQRVRQRTSELEQRNQHMRRVLDNVAQGLIGIDLTTAVQSERSAVVEEWFGPVTPGETFGAYMRRSDRRFAEWFEVAFPMLLEDVLPLDVAIAQLPTRVERAEREYRASYLPVHQGSALIGLLIVIDDVTSAVHLARAEADQKEQLVFFQRLRQDRAEITAFFREGAAMVETMRACADDAVRLKPVLHTLKGNAAMLGLRLLAEFCHRAENALGEGTSVAAPLEAVFERWAALCRTRDALLDTGTSDIVDVERAALERLRDRLNAGASAQEAARELTRWTLEPVERPLRRLGDYAVLAAKRLEKAEVEVVVSGGDLLAESRLCHSLWSVLVHLLRNAIDHGFETTSEREMRGKPRKNRVELEARLEQDDFCVRITDDGRGIDWAKVRALAEARGLPSTTRDDLFRALTTSGFSTRERVDETSGRGVGVHAVMNEVQRLGGRLSVESEVNAGCAWCVRVPASALGVLNEPPAAARPTRRSVPPSPMASA